MKCWPTTASLTEHVLTVLRMPSRTLPVAPRQPGSAAGSSPEGRLRRHGRRGIMSDTSSLDGRSGSAGPSQARRPAGEHAPWCSPGRPDARGAAAAGSRSGPRASPAAAEGAAGARGVPPGGRAAGAAGARGDGSEQAARRGRMHCERALADGLAELMGRLDVLKREKELADEAAEMLASQTQARLALLTPNTDAAGTSVATVLTSSFQ